MDVENDGDQSQVRAGAWVGQQPLSQGSISSGVTDRERSGGSSVVAANAHTTDTPAATTGGVPVVPMRQPLSASGKAAADAATTAATTANALQRKNQVDRQDRQAAAESLATLAEPTPNRTL